MFVQVVNLRARVAGTQLPGALRDAFIAAFARPGDGLVSVRLVQVADDEYVDTWTWESEGAGQAAFARRDDVPEHEAWNELVEVVSFRSGEVVAEHRGPR